MDALSGSGSAAGAGAPAERPARRRRPLCVPVFLAVLTALSLVHALAFVLAPAMRVRRLPSTTVSVLRAANNCRAPRPAFFLGSHGDRCWRLVVSYPQLPDGRNVTVNAPAVDDIPASADGCTSFETCDDLKLSARYNPDEVTEVHVGWSWPHAEVATAFIVPAVLFLCTVAAWLYLRKGDKRIQRNAVIQPLDEEVADTSPEFDDPFGVDTVSPAYGSSSGAVLPMGKGVLPR